MKSVKLAGNEMQVLSLYPNPRNCHSAGKQWEERVIVAYFQGEMMVLHPQETYVVLDADGSAVAVPGGPGFWQLPASELAACGAGWLLSEYLFDADWPSWEMHPHADEFVYLLSGAVTLHLEHPDGMRTQVLEGDGAVIIPRGVWHTAKVAMPSRMLHVTRGAGTETRPA